MPHCDSLNLKAGGGGLADKCPDLVKILNDVLMKIYINAKTGLGGIGLGLR